MIYLDKREEISKNKKILPFSALSFNTYPDFFRTFAGNGTYYIFGEDGIV